MKIKIRTEAGDYFEFLEFSKFSLLADVEVIAEAIRSGGMVKIEDRQRTILLSGSMLKTASIEFNWSDEESRSAVVLGNDSGDVVQGRMVLFGIGASHASID
jgi:hypothetical protein